MKRKIKKFLRKIKGTAIKLQKGPEGTYEVIFQWKEDLSLDHFLSLAEESGLWLFGLFYKKEHRFEGYIEAEE